MRTNPLLTNTPNAGVPNPGEALGDYPQRFKAHLQGQGYTRQTVAEYVRCIETLGRLMRQHGVGLGDLDEAQTAALLAQTESPLCRRTNAKYGVRNGSVLMNVLFGQRWKWPGSWDWQFSATELKGVTH